jgi:iron-sulfur cluster repair protein YtfE (RIC family)
MSSLVEPASPTVAEHYGHDHARLDDLLEQFKQLHGADLMAARPIFAEFKAGLERHIRWEEEILFPIFEGKTGTREVGPTAVMRWEHTLIKDFLLKIHGDLARQQTPLIGETQALQALLQLHNHKEENIIYPGLDAMIDLAERARLFAEMEKFSDAPPYPARA